MEINLREENGFNKFSNYLKENKVKNIFVVSFKYKEKPDIIKCLEKLEIKLTIFHGYTPNPTYEEVCNGVEEFKKSKSNFILVIGGGSAIDVAKCIKAFSTMDKNINYLDQEIGENDITLCVLPTTAGTGSEATKYAVIYYKGNKESVTSDYIIPNLVLFDSTFLKTLPIEIKKSSLMDVFSHSIEAMWSVNSTKESDMYAKKALRIILKYLDKYLSGEEEVYSYMLEASNLAGKAINITQTTAGHAMCYKLTSLYNIPHGQAAILVNSILFPYMIDNIDKCIDKRGKLYLLEKFKTIGKILNCSSLEEAGEFIRNLLSKLNLYEVEYDFKDLDLLVNSVNITRLKNNPILLDNDDIRNIYENLFREIERRK